MGGMGSISLTIEGAGMEVCAEAKVHGIVVEASRGLGVELADG